jgi:hypothetical protein
MAKNMGQFMACYPLLLASFQDAATSYDILKLLVVLALTLNKESSAAAFIFHGMHFQHHPQHHPANSRIAWPSDGLLAR